MKYAMLTGNKINMIKCDADFAAAHDHVITVEDEVQSGWIKGADGKITPPPGPTDAERIVEIKREANRRILELAPIWKQLNMLARGLELQNKGPANWTAVEQQEVDEMRSIWAQIKVIRAGSDDKEKQIKSK